MQFHSIVKSVVAFVVALLLSVFISSLLRQESIPDLNSVTVNEPKRDAPIGVPHGYGTSGPGDRGLDPGEKVLKEAPCTGTCAMKILTKERANYTDAARQNNVQGSVTLRVTFLASGQIGGITPIQGLPDGLTEQAIAAARKITFQPATKDGTPYTVTKAVQYSFSIY